MSWLSGCSNLWWWDDESGNDDSEVDTKDDYDDKVDTKDDYNLAGQVELRNDGNRF